MSKAFTREDDLPETPVVPRRASALPPGAQNLMTPDGAQRLHAELARLQAERERLLTTANDPDQPQKLAALEQRALLVDDSLRSASVVNPPATPDGRVHFGAIVTVREGGTETRYRIVGVDEVDFDRGWVSWLSPIAKALLNKRVGERVKLRTPGGERQLEILAVAGA